MFAIVGVGTTLKHTINVAKSLLSHNNVGEIFGVHLEQFWVVLAQT